LTKKHVLQSIFLLFSLISFGQDVKVDSTVQVETQKVRFGFYIASTYSYNNGDQQHPHYPGKGYSIYNTYDNCHETGESGFVLGFEIETKDVEKNVTFCTGIFIERFHYSGTCETTIHNYGNTTAGPPSQYYYANDYLNLPGLLRYSIKHSKNRYCIQFGASVNYFIGEQSPTYEFTSEKLGTSLIGGFDFFTGKKSNIVLGLRGCTQLNSTPSGRRMASVGLKFGVYI